MEERGDISRDYLEFCAKSESLMGRRGRSGDAHDEGPVGWHVLFAVHIDLGIVAQYPIGYLAQSTVYKLQFHGEEGRGYDIQ